MNSQSRDVSPEKISSESYNKRQIRTTFQKTADVDDPPFSRLFLLIPKALSEDELRQAFAVHGIIEDIFIVRDRKSRESKGYYYYYPLNIYSFFSIRNCVY